MMVSALSYLQLWGCVGIFQHILGVQGYVLNMITEGQKYVVNRGESIILVCDFNAEHYNLFDYPVLWTKIQHHEEYQINIMGNLNKPFVDTNRFQVSFSKDDPKHRLELFISDVMPEDSGNYSCEIRGPSSVVLTSVTHYVYIKTPVDSVSIQTANHTTGTSNIHQEQPRHSRRVTMIENTLNSVRCQVHGGYPAPRLTIKLRKKDITKHFNQVQLPKLTGVPGLRIITYSTEVWTESFVPTSENDGAKLRCIAAVPGINDNVTAIKLDVHYSPKIQCHSLSVPAYENNAALRCEIWFKPEITNLFWIIDVNGTTISNRQVIDGYWILKSEIDDNYIESQLMIRQARPELFGVYKIVVENSVAATTRSVELVQKFPTTTLRTPLNDPNSASQQDKALRFNNLYVPFANHGSRTIGQSGFIWICVIWTMFLVRR